MHLQTGGNRLILQRYESGEVTLQDLTTGDCRCTSDAALFDAIHQGLVLCEDQSRATAMATLGPENIALLSSRGATPKAIEHAVHLVQWLTVCRQRGIDKFVDKPWVRTELKRIATMELAGLPTFAITTLYEADLTLRKSNGDVCQLVPNYAGRGGAGNSRLDSRTQDLLQTIVKGWHLPLPRPMGTHEVWKALKVAVEDTNLSATPPLVLASESSVRRYIERHVPARARHEWRLGKKSAQKAYRRNGGARESAVRPLEVGEYDDFDACVFLVDERNGLPWGRSWVTNGVDQCTELPLGSYLGDKPRNYHSAIGAIADSLLPKGWCQPGEMGYGSQGVILVDNASYNTGKAMKRRSEAELLLLSRARPFGPTEKSTIEHYNHIVKSEFCPTLPGWAGLKGDRDALKEGMASAVLTIGDFTRLYRQWQTQVYANNPGEDGYTPKQRWLRFYEKHSPAVRYTPEQLVSCPVNS